MIQAYRRGLLRFEHPHGARSRLREEILLESIDAELMTDATVRSLQAVATITAGAPLQGQHRQKLLKDVLRDLRSSEFVRVCDFDGAAAYRFENSSLAVESFYDLLGRAGWVGDEGEALSEEPTDAE